MRFEFSLASSELAHHEPVAKRLLADRGYDYDEKCRRPLRDRGITPLIARKGDPHGSGLGVVRYVVERTHSWFARFRRLAQCYERKPEHAQGCTPWPRA